MRNLKSHILIGAIFLFIIISGLSIAGFYGLNLKDLVFIQKTDSPEIIEEDKIKLKTELEKEFWKRKIELLKNKIKEFDIDLVMKFNRSNLAVLPGDVVEERLHLDNGYVFKWNIENYNVEVPTFARYPKEIEEVKNEVINTLVEKGGIIFKIEKSETSERIEEKVYIGFKSEELDIITHHLSFFKIKPRARLAFIIDDLGYQWPEFERMMTIPRPMTFAVLPQLSHSIDQAQRALSEGYDLILHQPMEPLSNLNPGKGAIYSDMSDKEIIKTLEDNLLSLPSGIIGSNNHMGSKVTADIKVMEVVLKYLKDRGMFFIDSSTASNSAVEVVARKVGTPYQINNIFIDNIDEFEAIKKQILKAGNIALRKGQIIVIGHVRNYTARAILDTIDDLESMGIQIVYVKDLLLTSN